MATDVDQSLSLVQENIEEYVNDENKIVTCRWLSLMLNLNINAAKRALYTFVEHQRNKGGNDDINVTYFVAGLGKSKSGEKEHKCVVVPESDLDAIKKSLSVVTSCHIYSVQKAKLKDYTSLYMTDFDIIRDNLDKSSSLSSIKCPSIVKATKPRRKAAPAEVSDVKAEKNGRAESTPVASSTTNTTTPSTSKATTNKKAEPKGSIASMFAAAGKRGAGDSNTNAATKKSNEKADTGQSSKAKSTDKKSGMLAFFGSGADSKKKATENVKLNNGTQPSDKTEETRKQTARSKKEKDPDNEPDRKRRRRIIDPDPFDSSDDDNNAIEEEEERLRAEDSEEDRESPVCITSVSEENNENGYNSTKVKEEESPEPVVEKEEVPEKSTNGVGKKRKRTMKVVTKQFMDEDGFLVTKKESEWISDSDDSDVEIAAVTEPEKSKANNTAIKQEHKSPSKQNTEPKAKTGAKKSVVSPQKGKQTSISSFFKKK